MAGPDVMNQVPPQHQEILQNTWSSLLGAEGGTQNLAADLLKNLISAAGQSGSQPGSQPGAAPGGAGGDLLGTLGGLAGQFLGGKSGAGNGNGMGQSGAGFQGDFDQGGQMPSGGQGPVPQAGGDNNMWYQIGSAAGQFLGTRPKEGGGGMGGMGGGGAGGLVNSLGGLLGQGGGQNILGALAGGGGLAAILGSLGDPRSLLQFFMNSPVAQTAASPDSSSRDIYKILKTAIFSLMGSKLPAEEFNANPEAKTAWKGYLGLIANALRKSVGSG